MSKAKSLHPVNDYPITNHLQEAYENGRHSGMTMKWRQKNPYTDQQLRQCWEKAREFGVVEARAIESAMKALIIPYIPSAPPKNSIKKRPAQLRTDRERVKAGLISNRSSAR